MKPAFITLTILFLLSIPTWATAAPAMPNETIVKGVVEEYSLTSSKLLGIKPEVTLYKLVISIEHVENVKGPNFLKDKKGQFVTLYTKEKISSDFYEEKIRAKIEYAGDERGGLFWIKQIEIVK